MGEGDELLVYVAGETTTRTESVARCLGTLEPAVSPAATSDRATPCGPASRPHVIFVVEACHDGSDDDPVLAAEHVDAITQALDVRAPGPRRAHRRPPGARATPARGRSRARLIYALQDPGRATPGRRRPRVARRRAAARRGPEDGQVQSFAFVRGQDDFLLAGSPAAPCSGRPRPRPSRPPLPRAWSPSAVPAPSLPAIAPLLELADSARSRGAWEEALAGYKAALMVAPQARRRVARVHLRAPGRRQARAGQAARGGAQLREGARRPSRATAPPLDALIELAIDAKEPRRAIEWRRKRLVALDSAARDGRRAAGHRRARTPMSWATRARPPSRSRRRTPSPRRPRSCSATCARPTRSCTAGRASSSCSRRPAGSPTIPSERGRAALRGGGRRARAPARRGAGARAARARARGRPATRQGAAGARRGAHRPRRVEGARHDLHAQLVDRLAKLDDAERAWDACRKLGVLRRDKTRDGPGRDRRVHGRRELQAGRRRLARACSPTCTSRRATSRRPWRSSSAWRSSRPTRASTYARLFALHQRAGT